MLSYLCNRHYYSMTQLLPESLRPNQPEVLYYKTFINEDTLKLLQKNQKVNYRTLALKHKKRPLKAKSVKVIEKYSDGCPVCFEKHIYVDFYGYKHICSKCRNFVRDEHGNQVKIFINQHNEIVCVGMYPKQLRKQTTKYYVTDYTKLEVCNKGVFATFGGPNQLVLITRDKPIIEEDEVHD